MVQSFNRPPAIKLEDNIASDDKLLGRRFSTNTALRIRCNFSAVPHDELSSPSSRDLCWKNLSILDTAVHLKSSSSGFETKRSSNPAPAIGLFGIVYDADELESWTVEGGIVVPIADCPSFCIPRWLMRRNDLLSVVFDEENENRAMEMMVVKIITKGDKVGKNINKLISRKRWEKGSSECHCYNNFFSSNNELNSQLFFPIVLFWVGPNE